MKKANLTYQLIVMAFLIALEIVFTRFLSIQLPIARIGFGFLPVAVTAIMFGPIKAGICYAIGDVLGMLIFLPECISRDLRYQLLSQASFTD